MHSSMVKVLCILLRYFQDTVSNSIEPCTLCEEDIDDMQTGWDLVDLGL